MFLRLVGVFSEGATTLRDRHFHAVNVREIPISCGVKVWRFEITVDPAATRAEEPVVVGGFDAGGATFVAWVFGLMHGFELVGGEVCGLCREGSGHVKAPTMWGRGGFVGASRGRFPRMGDPNSSEENACGGWGLSGLFVDDAPIDGAGISPRFPGKRERRSARWGFRGKQTGSSCLSSAGFGAAAPSSSGSAKIFPIGVKPSRLRCHKMMEGKDR